MSNWDTRFLALAEHVASWSKDPSTKVGAVIVRRDKTIASLGFNGFPRGVPDKPEWLEDRPTKYAMTLHAEVNAILSSPETVRGMTLFVAPLHPCANCAAIIVQSGIRRVVARMDGPPERWADSFAHAGNIFRLAGVEVLLVKGENA